LNFYIEVKRSVGVMERVFWEKDVSLKISFSAWAFRKGRTAAGKYPMFVTGIILLATSSLNTTLPLLIHVIFDYASKKLD
jgi:hypothetical protein